MLKKDDSNSIILATQSVEVYQKSLIPLKSRSGDRSVLPIHNFEPGKQ